MTDDEQKLKLLRKTVGDLTMHLGHAHGTFMKLVTELRATELTEAQRSIIDAAFAEFKKEQAEFFKTYGDEIGGANPERN